MEGEEKSQDEKKSKIPMLRLRQAVERVKKERQAQKAREQPRRSSIPILKDAKKVIKRDASLNFTPQVDDEFDKLYEEIVDNNQKNIEEKLPSVTIEDPEKIETKFEEIIHAYDEDEHANQPVSRVSKIPSLKRKDDEGPSRLGALIERAKEKSTITESKLKDGGFKVTASTIKTKRFSRGNSRDLSSEQHIEVTETIDIRESGDNDVFLKETVIKKIAPAKPERNFRNITKRIVADNKAGEKIENIEVGGKQTTVTESLDKKDGTLNKTKRFNRTMSKETRERNLNRELGKNLENVRREFRNKIEDSRKDDEFNDVDNHVITTETITGNAQVTPIKTEKIVRGVSKEINEDGKNINSTETVTVEELEEGGTRTITTKTTETLVKGTPVVTEKVIRNISRNLSTEGQNNSIKGVTTKEESTDGGSKKVTKETYVKENKGIPLKTERFTRGISREMGNIKLGSSSMEIVTAVEISSPGTEALKKETKKTELIEKEGVKGIPVYTKVTRSFSKGKIQNVEMSRSIEWKPADEVKSKNFSRSVSEKVTQKELKNAGKWKYEAPIGNSEVTDVNDKSTEQSKFTCTQNKTPKDPVLETIIKDTVKNIANKMTTKKVTEYKSEEQVTNVEKTTYNLSSDIDLTVDRDFKASREIGTQMSIDGRPVDRNFKFVKEFGTQMSFEGKPLDSPFDRDFKLAKERNLEGKINNLIEIAGATLEDDVKTSKEFGTQMSTTEKTVSLSTDGNPKASREFGTQMSVVGKIVDRDVKISKEIGTQMSLEGNKQIHENDFDKVTSANVTKINKDSIITEKSEKEYSKLSTLDKGRDIAETTVLKGNVSRIKDKIAKETVVVSKKEPDEELPKKKSVLSKIAIFERLEPKEPHPIIEEPARSIKGKYVPPNLNRTTSADRPKIVDEVLKEQTQSEPLGGKVEIGVYYDEVTYTSEPVVVKEYSRTEEGCEQNLSEIKQVNVETKEVTNAHSQQETNDFKTATILPGIIDFQTQESQIEFAKTKDDKAQIQREPSVIEMPTILPAKNNYEADIGTTKPGKINLNSWSTQVEINKSTVDKIDSIREESLHDIAQTLPGKVDFKTSESQVPVSRDLPGIVDFKQEENQIESVTILPAKINFKSKEVVQTLVGRIDSKTNGSQNGESDNLPGITHGCLVDDVTTLPAKIDFKSYEIQTEIATTLPGKTEANSNQTEFTKTLTAFGNTSVEKQPKDNSQSSQKEVSAKPKPGKINLNLWQNQVETNKTLVGKTGIIKKSKEAELAKALSGRPNFNKKPVTVTETVPGNKVLNRREYKSEIAKTTTAQIDINSTRGQIGGANILPGKIEFDSTENPGDIAKPLLEIVSFSSNETQEATIRTLPETVNFSISSSQTEVATTLPGTIDFSTTENQVEQPKILTGKIEFETEFVANESKAEISETLQDNIYFGLADNQRESITLSQQSSIEKVGKLDLKAWEHKVEVNKTLVDNLDIVKGEHLEDIAKTLPGKINLITYESHVGEAKTFQAPINLDTEEEKVEITEIEVDTEAVENKAEAPKILPGAIEFNPFKHKPRFNPLPMLIRLNSQENKVLGKETGQGRNDHKDNVYKVEIPIESNPGETLSDPELVDEDPAVEAKSNNDSIIGSIKRKLYFISNKSSVQGATNTPMNTPAPAAPDDDNDYEKRVDELQTKTYSISNIGHKTNEAKSVSSMISIATGNSYEIPSETIEESYSYNVTDNTMDDSATEYGLSSDTNTVQNKLTKDANDFKSSPAGDYKQYLDGIEDNRNVTNENGFNFNLPKVGNELTRSAYGADDFITSKEELKRAKSLAELDLGDAVHGQVRRIIGRIKSVNFGRRESVKTEISIKEMPKKMSVWEKIALFETQESQEVIEEPTRSIKGKYVPPNLNQTTSADRPKIVDEVLKEQTQSEPLGDTGKVEIGVYYDEVTYKSEPVVVKEYSRTEEGCEQNLSEIKQVNVETKEVTNAHSQQETNDFKTATILPGIIDFQTQESQIEFAKTKDDKAQIQREPSVIEMPTILPAKNNYEADIGTTKPGKINLNSWSTQVEINKSTVDKIDSIREESLHDIAQTLPGKVDFKTSESQVPVSRDLPGIVDFKQEKNQIENVTILPAKINFESKEVVQTLVGRIDSKTNGSRNGESDNLAGITHGCLVDDVALPAKIDFKSYEIQTEIATTLPGKTEANSNQTEFTKTLTAFGNTSVEKQLNDNSQTSQKEVSAKPRPGKINLNLWQNQVETNKTLVGKTGIIKKSKEAELAKALSGRPNPNKKPVTVTETVPGNNVLNRREYKAEIAKTTTAQIDINPTRGQVGGANILPGKIEFDSIENPGDIAKPLLEIVSLSSNETQEATIRTLPETVNFSIASSHAEVATTLPGTTDFSTTEIQVEQPKILTGKIEFETEFVANESKAEISETLQDDIYFGLTDNQRENITLSQQSSIEKVGKLDLKAGEHQVEVNKTLVDNLDVVKGEHLEDIAKTLPGQIDFITYESHVGETKTFQAPINLNTEEDNVEITEIEVDTEVVENKAEAPKILPGAIEFNPFKQKPRCNPLPILIHLNSQANKVLGKETGQERNDHKDNVYKDEIPIESNPGDTLSDPELVDEDPVMEAKSNNDSIIGSIKRKLYFISNKSSIQDSTNTPAPAAPDDDNDYEKRVDELQTRNYSISNIGHKTNEAKGVSSMISIATGNSYEITAETTEESYSYTVTDNTMDNYSATEYELSSDTNTVQNKLTKDADDFKTSPAGDYKLYLDGIEDNRNVTNENGSNFNVPKVGNELTRSAYGADDFKTSTEELKRAESLAELDLGDAVHGQVRRIVSRINSVDFGRGESVKTEITIKEMPKKMSVLENIALFEGKTARSRQESTTIQTTVTEKTSPLISEEYYLKKIEELTAGKTKFGRLGNMVYLTLGDGSKMPVMALGTALADPRLLSHQIGAAIDMGYRAIDTAYIYGNEKDIGLAIKAKIDDGTVKREDLFIISKLWSTYHRPDLVEVACNASLKNMGLDYFDLYLIHNPMSFKEGPDPIPTIAKVLQYSQYDYFDAWTGMEGLVTKGLAKSIGVSNFNSQQIQRILDKGRLKPVINQVECHPYLSQQRLHAFCVERNITLSCFGVLGSKGTPTEYKNSTTAVIDDAFVKVMASGLGVTPAQLLIRYQIDSGHNVVVKASSAAHLWDNLQALNFTLKPSEIDALNALNRNKRTYVFNGMGDTHKNYPFLATY